MMIKTQERVLLNIEKLMQEDFLGFVLVVIISFSKIISFIVILSLV